MSTTPRHQITVEENVWQLTLATAPRGPVGASTFDELTDKTTAAIPTVNTPLAAALALLQPKPAEGQFADGDKTKLDGVEVGANNTQYGEGSDFFASGVVAGGNIGKRCIVTMSGDTALELPTGTEDGQQIAFIVFNTARDRFTLTNDDPTELVYSNASFIVVEMVYFSTNGWALLSFWDNPLKEKGDLLLGIGANERAHLPVGTDTQVLISDSTTATGLKWGPVVANTNANLTGHITSTGNAAILGSFTVAQLSTALSDATLSGNNTGDQDLSPYQLIAGSGTLNIDGKVNEAAGINKGDVVYITGATGGFPQVSLADNTDFAKADTIAVAAETVADNGTILCVIVGLLEDVDTSTFSEGAILYLSTAGTLTATHPTGVNAVQRVGRAIKINATTGSILVDIDQLTVVGNNDGILRHQIVNQNAGTSASAAYTVVNDTNRRASLSMVGSNYSAVAGIADSLILYNEGYNKTVNAVDGNFGFEWWTDTTDSHNLSSTVKMSLTAEGFLGIGTASPSQELHVVGGACVEHTAAQSDEHGLEIVLDAAGFGDVKALDINYVTGAIGAGEDEGIILINVDESLAAGGEVFALEVLTTTVGSDLVVAVKTGVGVDPISQDSGVFDALDSILNVATDVKTALSAGGAGNISIFVADNDTITVGNAAKFAELEVLIDTGASQNAQPTWEYSTGSGPTTWAAFTPTDGTNGFQNTGAMLWDSDDLAGWVDGTGTGEYLIRVTRTRNALSTTPIVDQIQAASPDIYSWDKDGNVFIDTLKIGTAPAYDDDTAAGVGGLVAGQTYQTTGAGGAPLNAAGIVMIKQ